MNYTISPGHHLDAVIVRRRLELDFIELRGIGERVCGAFPELAWNFDNIPAGPGHATNLLLPDLAANRGDGIAEGAVRLGYQAAVLGENGTPAARSCAQRVTSENSPSKAGVVRMIARSDHCRWVPRRDGRGFPGT